MSTAVFGRLYEDGEIIVRRGEPGDALYVVQEGIVEIVVDDGATEVVLRSASRTEILGEMAIFGDGVRSATMRAKGPSRVLTLDKRNFMRRMSEDPSLAFGMMEAMGQRIRELSDEVVRLRRLSELSPRSGATKRRKRSRGFAGRASNEKSRGAEPSS
jgi:CRP/FNR family transcriptional regulator, cyclic AMP receptor protein